MIVFNDTTNRTGAIQEMERLCGLGATGITSNTTLFQDFTAWANKWNRIGIKIAIKAQNGFDMDDPNWTTYPSGTYAGTTNRDYVFASTEQLLKLKNVGISYDGTNYVKATPIDSSDFRNVKADPNIDNLIPWGNTDYNSAYPTRISAPFYDPKANSIDIYPKFTQAQVDAGAKVYVEFYREPKVFATTTTDNYLVQFEELVTKGASYEYALLYKPDLVEALYRDIYGSLTRAGRLGGIINDMKAWYSQKYPRENVISSETVNSR